MAYPLEPVTVHCERLILYETSSFMYLVGYDISETHYRVLKIDRRVEKPKSLAQIISEDPIAYNKADLKEMLHMVAEGNRSAGGLVKVASAFGLVGFVKFLDCYYMTLIMQKKKVGCLAGNFIYTIKETQVFPIRPKDEQDNNAFKSLWKKLNKKLNQTSAEIAEARYFGLFQFVDLSKDFFFSYSYDLTHSLQHNYIIAKKQDSPASKPKTTGSPQCAVPPSTQDMFEWNFYQTEELKHIVGPLSAVFWVLPVIQGSFQQRRFNIFGRELDVILLARRSRHYAGTRYLKRGVNVHGKVANDCEIEQIVQLDAGSQATFSSYVQMRGSIPTYWRQETSVTMPKPPILINRIDPTYLATQVHFSDLLQRYSAPIIVLDLVKHHERRPREMLVGRELRLAVETLNAAIPLKHQIRYCALDSTKLSKSKSKIAPTPLDSASPSYSSTSEKRAGPPLRAGKEWSAFESSMKKDPVSTEDSETFPGGKEARFDKPGTSDRFDSWHTDSRGHDSANSIVEDRVDLFSELEDIAAMTIADTGIFVSTTSFLSRSSFMSDKVTASNSRGYFQQSGVLRTNCIDCLDRTNVGQFVVGMKFLAVSLRVLGLTSKESSSSGIGGPSNSRTRIKVDSLSLDPSNPLLVGLMDMYGELGDKIALQYGGSEAHKKGYGGHGTGGAASSKSGELLTSIKRYYSNAFTDNLKQDAMNVFLGCYVPNDQATPLWDLDSDYQLHNRSLHPPEPHLSRFLFNELLRDIGIISQFEQGITDGNSDPSQQRETARSSRDEDILRPPAIHLNSVIDQYLVRLREKDEEDEGPSAATVFDGPEYADSDPASPVGISSAQQTAEEPMVQLSSGKLIPLRVCKSVMRSEKRKFIKGLMEKRMQGAIETWWRVALREHKNRLRFNATLPLPSADVLVSKRAYFDRVHQPEKLTLFDDLFANEYLRPVNASTVTSARHNIILDSEDGRASIVRSAVADADADDTDVVVTEESSSIAADRDRSNSSASKDKDKDKDDGTWRSTGEEASTNFKPEVVMHSEIKSPSNSGSSANSSTTTRLGKYVREIGAKVRSSVLGISAAGKKGEQLTPKSMSVGSKKDEGEESVEVGHIGGLEYCDRATLELYAGYASCYEDPLSMLDNSTFITTPQERPREVHPTLALLAPQAPSHVVAIDAPLVKSDVPSTAGVRSTVFNPRSAQVNRARERRIAAKLSAQALPPSLPAPPERLISLSECQQQKMVEFELYLKEHSVHVDDVKGMEALAFSSHVTTGIQQGIYKGIHSTTNALQCHAFIDSCNIFAEEDLQAAMPEGFHQQHLESASTTANSRLAAKIVLGLEPASVPACLLDATTRAADSNGADVEDRAHATAVPLPHTQDASMKAMPRSPPPLPATIRSFMQKRAQEDHYDGTGIEAEAVSRATRYLNQQHAFGLYTSQDRLTCRWSFLTSESTVVMYCGQFCDGNSVADLLDEVMFITADRNGSNSEPEATDPGSSTAPSPIPPALDVNNNTGSLGSMSSTFIASTNVTPSVIHTAATTSSLYFDAALNAIVVPIGIGTSRLVPKSYSSGVKFPDLVSGLAGAMSAIEKQKSSRRDEEPRARPTATPDQFGMNKPGAHSECAHARAAHDSRSDSDDSEDDSDSDDDAPSSESLADNPLKRTDYSGFVTIGQDLYARIGNPQLLLNEVAVRSFCRLQPAALDQRS